MGWIFLFYGIYQQFDVCFGFIDHGNILPAFLKSEQFFKLVQDQQNIFSRGKFDLSDSIHQSERTAAQNGIQDLFVDSDVHVDPGCVFHWRQ